MSIVNCWKLGKTPKFEGIFLDGKLGNLVQVKIGEACTFISAYLRNFASPKGGISSIPEVIPHSKERTRLPKSYTSEIRFITYQLYG